MQDNVLNDAELATVTGGTDDTGWTFGTIVRAVPAEHDPAIEIAGCTNG